MRKHFLYIFTLITIVAFTGCESIATKEDIDAVKERVSSVEEDFYTTSRAIAKRFKEIEFDIAEKTGKLENEIKQLSQARADLSERISSLEKEIRGLKGKIEEVDFNFDEKLKEEKDERERKNLELKREIEGLKKTYNDLISSISSLNKTLTVIQKDIVALRNSQVKIANSLKEISEGVNRNAENNLALQKKLNSSLKVFLNELTRQESEIYRLKREIGILKEKGTITQKGRKRYYIVKKGDYLGKIAKRYGTTVKKLKRVNKLKSDVIYPGQKLIIP